MPTPFEPFKAGENPRGRGGHRERGPKVYGYTREDVATLVGLRPESVPVPRSLLETAQYVLRKVQARIQAPSADEMREVMGERDWGLWQSRWPLVSAWLCPTCRSVVLAPSFCEAHGGGRQALCLDGGIGMEVLTEAGYRPYARILLGEPPGMVVAHADRNVSNNRLANLVVMTPAEFRARGFGSSVKGGV